MKHILYIALFLLLMTSVFAAPQTVVNLLNQDPDPAISGEIVEIRVGVENLGDEAAENFVVEIDPEYPFSQVQGESLIQEIGTLGTSVAGNNMRVLKFKVRIDIDATAGSYNLPVLGYEIDKKELAGQRLFVIDVESRESAEVIYIDQVELIPGQVTPLTFTINNVGSTPLRDLSFQWENEEDIILPVGSDNTKYIKYIDVGENEQLDFNVIASATADPDLYKLDLILTYDDPVTNEETVISTKAGVYVGGSTDFDVAFSGNTNGEYSFSVSNIGSVSASSVTVKIPKQNEWKVSGTDSVIIGNLNKGDYTIATFNLVQEVNEQRMQRQKNQEPQTDEPVVSRPVESDITLNIMYTDTRGNRETVSKTLTLTPSQTTTLGEREFSRQRQSTMQTLWSQNKTLIIVLGVGIVLFMIHKRYKKRKLKDPKYTYKKMITSFFR